VQLRLGPNSGEVDTVQMTVLGSSVTFTETAQAGYAPGLSKTTGDNQSALPSALLPRPLMVKVPSGGNIPVQFSVISGGAQIQATQTSAPGATLQAVSDASGRAWVYVVAPATMGTHAIIRATSGSAIADFLLTTSTNTEYSNRNKVYQYQTTFPGANGEALLWIPEGATVIRGVLFMRQNIPEGIIAADPMVRSICAKHGLAILYGDSQVWYDGVVPANVPQSVSDLKSVLATLAAKSGYSELANVPWLPIGESFSIAMVQNLRDATPSRTLAAIFVNDIDLDPSFGTDRTVPTLAIQSTAGELVGQNTVNLTTYWSDPTQTGESVSLNRGCAWKIPELADVGVCRTRRQPLRYQRLDGQGHRHVHRPGGDRAAGSRRQQQSRAGPSQQHRGARRPADPRRDGHQH
jgi:hypothetical protein